MQIALLVLRLQFIVFFTVYHDNNGDAGKAIDETYGGQPIVSTQCGIFYDNDMEAISDMCCSPNYYR